MTKRQRIGFGNGLYKQIVGNSQSWLLRYHVDGRERTLGLGSTKVLGLKAARARVIVEKAKILGGVDPIEEKRAAKVARRLEAARTITFRKAAEEYYKQNESSKWTSANVRRQFGSSMETYVYPKIGHMAVRDIGTDDVLRVLDPIWYEKPETAGRVRRRIEWVLAWCAVRGYRVGDNPAAWRGHLSAALPAKEKIVKVEHMKAVPYREINAFWQKVEPRLGGAAAALKFMLFTIARNKEIRLARWCEIDFENRLWTIPTSGRAEEKDGIVHGTKTAEEYVIPLSDEALAIVEAQPSVSEYIFIGPAGRLSENAINNVVKKSLKLDYDPHGLRSTFTDWAHDCTRFDKQTIDHCISHSVGSKIDRAYRRGTAVDKRRLLLRAWAKYVTTPTRQADVIPIRAASFPDVQSR